MTKIRDLTGQEFGFYTALYRLTKDEKKERGIKSANSYWMCRCRCGTEKPVYQGSLSPGHANSCGCARFRNVKPGATFGSLTIIRLLTKSERKEYGKNPSQPYWLCQCSCGGETVQQTSNLLSGNASHCGCVNSLAGQQFGRLTVVEDTGKRLRGQVVYSCKCSCGKMANVPSVRLTNGETSSCGCLYDERRLNLLNQRFGRLVVQEHVWSEQYQRKVCKCLCDCGSVVEVYAPSLVKGLTVSCGCYRHEKMRGESNPSYRHDLSDEDRKKRGRHLHYAEEQNAWRKACFEREDYTCQISKQKGNRLAVHHILNYSDNPDLRWDVSNGFVMDVRLHILFHSLYGNRHNDKAQLLEFKKSIQHLSLKSYNSLLGCFHVTSRNQIAYNNKERAMKILAFTIPNSKNITIMVRQ